MTKKKKDSFFVAIGSPESIRISVLECIRECLQSMKQYQAIKEIRYKKLEEKRKLRTKLRKIMGSLQQLKSSMPHLAMPEDAAMPKPKVQAQRPAKLQNHPPTDLERIESQLKEIGDKLAQLS